MLTLIVLAALVGLAAFVVVLWIATSENRRDIMEMKRDINDLCNDRNDARDGIEVLNYAVKPKHPRDADGVLWKVGDKCEFRTLGSGLYRVPPGEWERGIVTHTDVDSIRIYRLDSKSEINFDKGYWHLGVRRPSKPRINHASAIIKKPARKKARK